MSATQAIDSAIGVEVTFPPLLPGEEVVAVMVASAAGTTQTAQLGGPGTALRCSHR